MLANHAVLGDVRQIRVPGQHDFVAKMAVPTFACTASTVTAPTAAGAADGRRVDAGPNASKWTSAGGTPQSSSAGTRLSISAAGPQR